MSEQEHFYALNTKQALALLKTTVEGLSPQEIQTRQKIYGKNQLNVKIRVPAWVRFLAQFKEVFAILLMVAACISFFIGSVRDGSIMLIIVIINAITGYYQEHKAESIMDRLKSLVQSPAKAVRENKLAEVNQADLVPGDIIFIEEGDKVPADLRIIEAFNLRTNDFSLTGESMPQEKNTITLAAATPLPDRDNMAYLGTTVATGSGKGVVVATGMATELGKIANLTQEESSTQSPLQAELQVIANRISVFAVIIGLALFGITIWQGLGAFTGLIYGLGIAVAVVPQALPMQITVALSQGVARLATQNAVVKKLAAVETLGSTNVIATDKTGTLTKNEMTVKNLWFNGKTYEITGLGYEPRGSILDDQGNTMSPEQIQAIEIMLDAATMSSNAEIHEPDENHAGWYPIGDPTEAALITLSTKLGTRSRNEDKENPELHEFGFDSFRKRMSSVRQIGDKKVLFMKGALDATLAVTKYFYDNGKAVPITEQHKKNLQAVSNEYSRQAMRVLAFAYRELKEDGKDYILEDMEKEVVFLGLMAMIDPPKEDVKTAVEHAKEAHIKIFIMTGDHAVTAQSVAKLVNLAPEGADTPVIIGNEFKDLKDEQLGDVLKTNDNLIFSRVSPEDKLRIVRTLKEQGNIVAVTGDGVNDAPALKSAHIGVAMGRIGTDVSKEAADLVLLDDSFSTLVYAIREGRTIYHNLKKTILASLTSNIAELTVVLMGLVGVSLLGWPIPILAIQILAIDLLAEILPLTALTFDPGSKELMTAPPRRQDDHIVNKRTFSEIIFFGFLMGGLAFLNFVLFTYRSGAVLSVQHPLYPQATTVSYVTIAFCQFANIMSRRYEFVSIFSQNFWNNKNMLKSLGLSLAMIITAVYAPFIGRFLGFSPLQPLDWLMVLAATGIFLSFHELVKYYKRQNQPA